MKYALLNANNECVEVRNFPRVKPDANLPNKGLRWVPYSETRAPYDRDTQVLTGPVRTIYDNRVEDVWTVTDKTPEQLASEAEAVRERTLDGMDRALQRIALNHENRLRALERFARTLDPAAADAASVGQARENVTAAQFRAFVKAML